MFTNKMNFIMFFQSKKPETETKEKAVREICPGQIDGKTSWLVPSLNQGRHLQFVIQNFVIGSQ